MKFNCKTRMQRSPQGLSKVYYCAHPKDAAEYLEEISKELLALQNCAIWYDEEPEKDYDRSELSDALKDMNLLVFPVTRALLTEKSRALDVEIPFALKNHIPLLPIMKENELEELFNQKIGNIQFLAENMQNDGSRPYKERLERFLSSIIIGDELTAKIRNAFDAYIFLSYRKKDRKQATELMGLIHQNDFMRDIAIWYDEYLIPGENFNEAIRSAFEKSSLFLLNVTPSILEKTLGEDGEEKKNYVMQTEYPMAVTAHKLILPAETVTTDKEKLSRDYPELPPCIKAKNTPELCTALYNAFKDIALRANDSDPEHNFFIGLAYLNGIDVETNKPLGTELIRNAAKSGLPEAMKKLISMYEDGDGLERSMKDAITWRERLIERYEEIYHSDYDERIGNEWFWEVIYLSDAYGAAGNEVGQAECTENALRIAKEQFEKHNTYNAYRNLFVAYERLGNSMKAKGHISEARQCYNRGLEIAKYISDNEGTDEAIRDLSLMHNRLGDIAKSKGELSTAREHYLCALKLREQIAERCTELTKRDIPVCYYSLGDIESKEGNFSAAIEYYQKGLKITEDIAESINTVLSTRDLSLFCGRLGDLEAEAGRLDAARGYYERSLGYNEKIHSRRDTAESRHDLVTDRIRLAFVALECGDDKLSEAHYLSAFDIARKALDISDTLTAKRDLWHCLIGMAKVMKQRKSFDLAIRHSLEALRLADEMRQSSEDAQSRLDYFKSISMLGDVSLDSGDTTTATDCYLKSLDLIIRLNGCGQNVKNMRDLVLTYTKLGNIAKSEGELLLAKDHYLNARNKANEILDICYSVKSENDLSIITSSLGEVMQALGDTASARECFAQSLIAAESVVRHCQTANTLDALGVAYYKASFYEEGENREAYLNNALAIYKGLTKDYPHNKRFEKNLGLVKKQLKQ